MPGEALIVAKMLYDRVEIEKLMKDIVNHAMGWMMPLGRHVGKVAPKTILTFLNEFSTQISKELLLVALRAKHSGFSSEDEVRATIAMSAVHPDSRLKFRTGRNGHRVPYLSLKMGLARGGIVELMTGPRVDAEVRRKAERLLSDADLNPRQIMAQSALPYR